MSDYGVGDCGIVGKRVVLTWETLCKTEMVFKKKSILHKTPEAGDDWWSEASAIILPMTDSLFCVNWEDGVGNSFTLLLDTKTMEAKATWTYEEGVGNSKLQHTVGSFKFIN